MSKEKDPSAVALGRRGGVKGGLARAAKLSPERRKEIASQAAQARWSANPGPTGPTGPRRPPPLMDRERVAVQDAFVISEQGLLDFPIVDPADLESAASKLAKLAVWIRHESKIETTGNPEAVPEPRPRVRPKFICERCRQAMREAGAHLSVEDCVRWLVLRLNRVEGLEDY
jgi:hypothetical protein